jgi:hypothetical protein
VEYPQEYGERPVGCQQDKRTAPQIVGWWTNFFSSIWAFQLSFRPALIHSSQVGVPDSFGLTGSAPMFVFVINESQKFWSANIRERYEAKG